MRLESRVPKETGPGFSQALSCSLNEPSEIAAVETHNHRDLNQ